MRKHKKPSRTRRHREAVAAKRRARAFYKTRNKRETETSAGRRMRRVAVLVDVLLAVAAVLAATAAWILS